MDHLFISYAVEDAPLARWLTLKLTIAGYKAWCFEFQMLGGERFPKTIDAAIKTQTFRMLGLVSRASIKKDNPIKEWTLAQALGKERNVDFLVPLNVDGVSPTELPWTLSDTNWISFHSLGWAGAFRQLLKLLERLNTPKVSTNPTVIGPEVFLETGVLTSAQETLVSNSLKFRAIPDVVREYRPSRELSAKERADLRDLWAHFRVNDDTFLAFGFPPDDVPVGVFVPTSRTWNWKQTDEILGVSSHNVVSNLLRSTVATIFLAGGCRYGTKNRALYFPGGLFDNDRIHFTSYKGRRTYVATKGRSTFYRRGAKQECNYHLGFRHNIVRNKDGEWLVYLKLCLRITEPSGKEFDPKPALSRRKAITKGWWNDKLLNRYLALASALQAFQQLRRFSDEKDQILVEPALVTFVAPAGIDESRFDSPAAEEDGGANVTATLGGVGDEDDDEDNGD